MAYIDPTKTSPNNYRLLLENDAVRVLEMSLRAGEKDQQHSHQNETVYFITGSKVRIHLPGSESVEADLPNGHVMWHEAWTHRVENVGSSDMPKLQPVGMIGSPGTARGKPHRPSSEEVLTMFARVTTVASPSDRAEDTVRHIQDEVLPRIEQQTGSQGGLWLLDRQTGKVLAITLWKDEDAMRASQGQVTQVTGQSGQQLAIATQTVEGFEVVAQV